MTHDNMIPPPPQATTTPDYRRLIWNVLFGIGAPGSNEQLMLEKEVWVAHKVLDWLNSHPEYEHYRKYIKAIPYADPVALETTSTLHFNLWMRSDAALWIPPHDAKSHNDLLWQFALRRLSCFLNIGEFTPPSPKPVYGGLR